MNDITVSIPQDKHRLPSHDTAIACMHVFMGSVPVVEAVAAGEPTYVRGPVFTLAKLNAFKFTSKSCVSDKGKPTSDGHRQKRFHDAFAQALPIAVAQLNECCSTYVQMRASLDIQRTASRKNRKLCIPSGLEAATVIRFPRIGRHLLAVNANWFRTYIIFEPATFHDCYISELDMSLGPICMLSDIVKHMVMLAAKNMWKIE